MEELKRLSFAKAYSVVSSFADVRSRAIWVMLEHIEQHHPVTVTVSLSKHFYF